MSSKNTNLYDHPYLKNNINFCVSCGSKLIFRSWIEGDSSKQLCCSKTNCNYVHFLDPKLATGVITLLDNKLILLQRSYNPGKNLWTFPGGFVNRGEIVEEAAKREVFEEVGLKIDIKKLLGVYSFSGEPTVLVAYIGIVINGIPTINNESSDIKLISNSEINLHELAFETTKAAIKDYQKIESY